jgi:hypothetical protein
MHKSRFQAKNAPRNFVCTASLSKTGQTTNLTCSEVPAKVIINSSINDVGNQSSTLSQALKKCGLVIPAEKRLDAQNSRQVTLPQKQLGLRKRFAQPRAQSIQDGCCEYISITPDDFGPNRDTTYSIREPGVYKLIMNVPFNTVNEYDPAIEILVDDVELDLCHHTLSQGNTTSNGHGIRLGLGYAGSDPNFVVSNVTIKNGTIRGFTGIGIFAFNASFDGNDNVAAFQDIRLHKLKVLDCGSRTTSTDFGSGIDFDARAGSFILTPVSPPYRNVWIEEVKVERSKGNGGVQILGVENCFIFDSTANNTVADFAPLQSVFGWILVCKNLQMFRCQGNGSRNFTPTPVSPTYAGQTGGIGINDSINVLVKDGQFNDFFAENDYIVNNNLSINYNDVYEDCQFNGASGGAGAILVFCVHRSSAFAFNNTYGKGSRFTRCDFNQSSISPQNPGGAAFSSIGGITSITYSDCLFDSCRFVNHDVQGNLGYKAFGAIVGTEPYQDLPSNGVIPAVCQTFRDCIAADITGGNSAGGIFSIVANFNRTGTQRAHTDIVMQGCIAERIHSLSDAPLVTMGLGEGVVFQSNNGFRPFDIYTFFDKLRNLQITDSRVSNVKALGAPSSKDSAGIYVFAVRNAEITKNSVTDCDRGILFTGTADIIPNAFQLAATFSDATAEFPVHAVLTSIPPPSPLQTFTNLTTGTQVTIAPSARNASNPDGTIELTKNPNPNSETSLIWPTGFDLTGLNWKPGDQIRYDCNGGTAIGGLKCGTVYYLIVYSPGFVKRGLVQQNNVTNCSISGFQDDKVPHTSSVWISNVAYCNGTAGLENENYNIHWGGKSNISHGSSDCYPEPKVITRNISISCGPCDCPKRKNRW